MNIASWGAAEWSAAAEVFFSIAAVFAGFWTLYNYRLFKKAEIARWVKAIFIEFYISDTFDSIRAKIEYEFEGDFDRLVSQRFYNRDIPLTDVEKNLLKEMDTLLNYFEHLLYLEKRGQLQKRDRNAIFEYWFDILKTPKRAILRRYAAYFGFERLARELKVVNKDFIVLYGTLQKGEEAFVELKLDEKIKYLQPCTFFGTLVNMGDYPAFVNGNTIVHGGLYEVIDKSVFKTLDKFEKFYANDLKNSLYIRKCIALIEPEYEAWIYEYNSQTDGKLEIKSGRWEER